MLRAKCLRGPSEKYDRVCGTSANKYHGLTPFFYKEKIMYIRPPPKILKIQPTPRNVYSLRPCGDPIYTFLGVGVCRAIGEFHFARVLLALIICIQEQHYFLMLWTDFV